MNYPARSPFSSANLFRATVWVILAFAILNVVAYTMRISTDLPGDRFMMVNFGLDRENNVPTWFSVVQLALAGIAAFLVSTLNLSVGDRRSWRILAAGMLFMSLDEMSQIHEMASRLQEVAGYPDSVWLKFAWVVPGAAVAIAAGLLFWGFLRRLPGRTSRNLILSGVLFLGGAIGMEMFGSYTFHNYGELSYPYMLCVTLEEGLEMLGIAWFIRTTLAYAEARTGRVSLLATDEDADNLTPFEAAAGLPTAREGRSDRYSA